MGCFGLQARKQGSLLHVPIPGSVSLPCHAGLEQNSHILGWITLVDGLFWPRSF
jgi:hypothetical protein